MKKRLGFDLVILGAPASGKDTQAILLEKKFVLKPVESGKYLRGLAKHKTKIAEELRRRFAKGLPAPSKLIEEFLLANFRRAGKSDLVFVGNPRLLSEAKFLEKLLDSHSRDFYVIFITLPDAEVWKRSAKRMRDGQDLHHVRARIAWHKAQVGKTVRYFKKQKKLTLINGNQTIKQVNKDILEALNDYSKRIRN